MKTEILADIKQYDTIIIHRHVRPDPDAYGSQGGLAEILKASFPEKRIYTVGKEEPSLNYLRRFDDISDETYEGALSSFVIPQIQHRICDITLYKWG